MFFGCCFLLLLMNACKPRDVLSREEMADVLYDIHLTEAALKPSNVQLNKWKKSMSVEQFKDMAYRSVLKKHKLTEKTFYYSVAWYSKHMNYYEKVYRDVLEKLESYQALVSAEIMSEYKSDSTSAKNQRDLSKLIWKFAIISDTERVSGCSAKPRESVLNTPKYMLDTYLRPTIVKDSLHRMVSTEWSKKGTVSPIDTLQHPINGVQVEPNQVTPEVKRPQAQVTKVSTGGHFVEFEPKPRTVTIKKVAADEQIRNRFKSRLNEKEQR